MSIKVTVDNNFFDSYEKYQDSEIKSQIIQAFINKRLSFYPSLQLISEVVSIYETKRRDLLPRYSKLFLDIVGYRCFNDWNRIIRSELGLIQNESIFLEKRHFDNLKHILKKLSQGYIRRDIKDVLIEAVKLEKEKSFKKFKENQEHHFKLLKEQNIKTPKSEYVFIDEEGKPYGPRSRKMIRRLQEILKEAGITSISTIHELRHTFCSQLFSVGLNPREVQRQMRHSDLEITEGYAHIFMPEYNKKIKRLERLDK